VRVAFAGKGGAGKTTLAATAARLLARQGQQVLVVDADSNPNVATALGVAPAEASGTASLPTSLVSRRIGGPALTADLEEVLATHSLNAPDGVRVVLMGMPTHAEEGCLCAAHATVSALLDDVGARPGWVTVVDMEASPEHLSRGTVRHVDVLALVAEPYYRALETVRRMSMLAAELTIPRVAVVANKIRSEDDTAAVTDFCDRHGLALAGCVPWSDAVIDADTRTRPIIDEPAAADVVDAVSALTRTLLAPVRA
jgi:CO dehydrogenase maturation factor